jgi:hypothetical protein
MDENTKKIYEKYGINPEKRERELQIIDNEKINELNLQNENHYRKVFEKGIAERFPDLCQYLHHPVLIFTELQPKFNEIISCIIMESYSASITLTNHVLERLLKLALIIDTVGLDKIKIEDWNSVYSSIEVDKINSKKLNDTINMCKSRNLISEEEKNHLHLLRESIRNGFSHFDPKQIFKDEIDIKTFTYQASNSKEKKPFELNFKSIPMLQSVYTNLYAKENAQYFFEVVFKLTYNIQKRIRIKFYNL